MLRDEYFRRLAEAAQVDLFLSANDGARIWWPWRMQPPCEATQRYRNACEQYVIDSDPLDDSVTTTDVLDAAHELNAEVASLQDIYKDCDATADALLEGLATADDHAFDGDLLLPLQRPYDECYEQIGRPDDHWIGLGGLKDSTPETRLTELRSFRSAVGDGVHIHGFGWGVHGLTEAIRSSPELINSVDYSTPVQDATGFVDATPGEEISSVTAMDAARRLVQDLREVSEYPDQEPTRQITLA